MKKETFMILFSRSLFLIHTVLTVWKVTVVLGNIFWLIGCGIAFFFLDAFFVLRKRNGKEWTWFQPIILFYLLLELPCICLIELHQTSLIQYKHNTSMVLEDLYQGGKQNSSAINENINIGGGKDAWSLLLEQSMLFLLILARWMMPKGELTRNQLSALLLRYLGIASDVLDFFSILAESNELLLDLSFVFTVLITSSWSMMQFVFVTSMTHIFPEDEYHHIQKLLQQTTEMDAELGNSVEEIQNANIINIHSANIENDRMNKNGSIGDDTHINVNQVSTQKVFERDLKDKNSQNKLVAGRHLCKSLLDKLHTFIESEVWSIFVSLVMQDGPYMIVRFLCIFYWNMRTYTYYFFAAKNCLVIILQIYRLVAVYQEYNEIRDEREFKKRQNEKELLQLLKTKSNRQTK